LDALPKHGGRIELRLESADAKCVRYALELLAPGGASAGYAEVSKDNGDVVVRAEPEPPAWLLSVTRGLLRTLWRDRRASGAPPWPNRLTRWREGPR
jgi:hypothetical protein